MKSRIVALTLSASLASFSLFATAIAAEPPAKGDAAAGATKAAVCGACHGATGNSVNPEWPSLAGQHHGYISEQLALLKAGVRVAPVMAPMAMALSNEDMADLGAYFEQQTPAGLEANADLWQAGEKLYRGGDTTRSIPGCLGCHGSWAPLSRRQQTRFLASITHTNGLYGGEYAHEDVLIRIPAEWAALL